MKKYEPYVYCVVCGKYVKKDGRYPHGYSCGIYCIKHTKEIQLTRQQILKNLQEPDTREDIVRRFKNKQRPEDIAVLYMVSNSAVRTVITQERYERERR